MYLGCLHERWDITVTLQEDGRSVKRKIRACIYNMESYLESCIELYTNAHKKEEGEPPKLMNNF